MIVNEFVTFKQNHFESKHLSKETHRDRQCFDASATQLDVHFQQGSIVVDKANTQNVKNESKLGIEKTLKDEPIDHFAKKMSLFISSSLPPEEDGNSRQRVFVGF